MLTYNDPQGLVEFRNVKRRLVLALPSLLVKDVLAVALVDGWRETEGEAAVKRLLAVYDLRLAGEGVESPKCASCKDTGGFWARTGEHDSHRFVNFALVDGEDIKVAGRRFKTYPCAVCGDTAKKDDLYPRMQRSGLPDPAAVLARAHDIYWDLPGREKMGQGVRALCISFNTPDYGGMTTLVGRYESGKSVLIEETIRAACAARLNAVYVSGPTFKMMIDEMFERAPDAAQESPTLDRMRNAQVLALDNVVDWIRELRADGKTTYAAEVLRDLVEYRNQRRNSVQTIFAVNLAGWYQGGEDALGAVYSRMRRGMVYITETEFGLSSVTGQLVKD